jgi:hypothetical protein
MNAFSVSPLHMYCTSMCSQIHFFSFSFPRVYHLDALAFWNAFGRSLHLAGADNSGISCSGDFLEVFAKSSWKTPVVLLLDEFSELYRVEKEIRNDFLQALRSLKHDTRSYALHSVIAAGTYSIVDLNPEDSFSSPFNISDCIQNPYFNIEETRSLFAQFASDKGIFIEDAVVEDIWAKSNGFVSYSLICQWKFICGSSHPGMVCLCGRCISDRMDYFLDPSSTITFDSWDRFPANDLYNEIAEYNTFKAMVHSLLGSDADKAMVFFRYHFSGYLGDVNVQFHDLSLANFLTSEGVLLRPSISATTYRMASPLIDGLLRTLVIPEKFVDAPTAPPPYQDSE